MLLHVALATLLEMKVASNQLDIGEMERNIGPEGSLKVNANVGWVQVLDYRGEPIEYLPIIGGALANLLSSGVGV